MIESSKSMIVLIIINMLAAICFTSFNFYGVPFMIIGGIIYFYHKHLMGKMWSLNIEPKKEIITSGLFKYIRHPLYLGAMIFLLGLIISTLNLLLMFVFVFITFPFLYTRARLEEKVLMKSPKYRQYMKRTRMFTIMLK